MGARLAQWFAVKVGHLVRTNDHRFGKARGDSMGLGQGEAAGQVGRGFLRPGRLVDIGRDDVLNGTRRRCMSSRR